MLQLGNEGPSWERARILMNFAQYYAELKLSPKLRSVKCDTMGIGDAAAAPLSYYCSLISYTALLHFLGIEWR